jgi:hypothetical protein
MEDARDCEAHSRDALPSTGMNGRKIIANINVLDYRSVIKQNQKPFSLRSNYRSVATIELRIALQTLNYHRPEGAAHWREEVLYQ